jgi:hypothetical protein
VFRPAGLPLSYPLEGADPAKVTDAAVRITAETTALRPKPSLRLIQQAPATGL